MEYLKIDKRPDGYYNLYINKKCVGNHLTFDEVIKMFAERKTEGENDD